MAINFLFSLSFEFQSKTLLFFKCNLSSYSVFYVHLFMYIALVIFTLFYAKHRTNIWCFYFLFFLLSLLLLLSLSVFSLFVFLSWLLSFLPLSLSRSLSLLFVFNSLFFVHFLCSNKKWPKNLTYNWKLLTRKLTKINPKTLLILETPISEGITLL